MDVVPESSVQSQTSAQCVARRVDALTLAYQIQVSDALWTSLEGYRMAAERERHPLEVDLGSLAGCAPFVLAVMPMGGPSRIVLRNGDLIATVVRDASHGWTVEVRILAAYLALNTPPRAVAVARWFAGFFGPFDAERGERCRRLDLATDWTGWVLDDREDARLVTRPRARKTKFRPTHEETLELPESRVYKVAQSVTGVAVSYGAPLMCRLYDKTAELQHSGAEAKRDLEQGQWKSGGWDGVSKVVRVEYQIRGDVLEELGLRDNVDVLLSKLDGVWHYLTHEWLTLRVLGTSTRLCRAALDPRWEAVQRVRWGTSRTPVERVRRRAGASLRQTLGCVLSSMGSSGVLESAVKPLSSPSVTEALQLDSGAASAGLRSWVGALCCAFALFLEAGLLTEASSPQDAFGELVLQVRGSVARFSVLDESLDLGRWEHYANGRRTKGRRSG